MVIAVKHRPPKIVREKRAKKESELLFWKVFAVEGALFLLTSVLAVISAFKLNALSQSKQIYLPVTNLQDFLFSFIFVTFFILILVAYKKAKKLKGLIYKGLFLVTVFYGGMTVLNLFIPVWGVVLVMGALIFLWLENPTVWVHDILMVFGLAGAASFFGLSFSPSVVIALLFIFSVYDFIAVYKTEHMVMIAKDMIDKKVILGFIIPKELKHFKDRLKNFKLGGNYMILGGGDIVFPSLLAVSIVPYGILRSLLIVLFSLAGVFVSYWIFTTQKAPKGQLQPIPALPPIALFTIMGYLITLFV